MTGDVPAVPIARRTAGTLASPLVLVIDQFEELWTLVTSDAVRDRFAASIAATLDSGHDIRIIATLRADLYDRLLVTDVHPVTRDPSSKSPTKPSCGNGPDSSTGSTKTATPSASGAPCTPQPTIGR